MAELEYDDESEQIHPHDRDPSNVLFRAGFLRGLASKLPSNEDKVVLRRAAKSLRAFAEKLREEEDSSRQG